MKSLTRGNVKTALASVRSAKWRSFLTMMGIIIGIVSVVTIVSIGEGVKNQVASQISQAGKNMITIRPGQLVNRDDRGKITGVNLFSGMSSTGALGDRDVELVKGVKGVMQAVPLSIVAGTPVVDNKPISNVTVIGTTADLPSVLKQKVAYGDFFSDENSGQDGVVIGSNVARTVFNDDVPLGRNFTFHDQTFIVRGVFAPFKNAALSLDTDFNNAIFIPYPVARDITQNNASIYEILVQPASSKQAPQVAAAIKSKMEQAHGGQDDFTVLTQSDTLSITDQILNLLTRLIAGIAAISLLVGGIGIMNVMLVSVTERMHEIGIRKAIGATSRQIMTQFLIEASVLCVVGGIIGVIVALVISLVLRIFTNLEPVVSWQVVLLAAGVSLIVGIIFGTAPALKAARKDPIEALRNE